MFPLASGIAGEKSSHSKPATCCYKSPGIAGSTFLLWLLSTHLPNGSRYLSLTWPSPRQGRFTPLMTFLALCRSYRSQSLLRYSNQNLSCYRTRIPRKNMRLQSRYCKRSTTFSGLVKSGILCARTFQQRKIAVLFKHLVCSLRKRSGFWCSDPIMELLPSFPPKSALHPRISLAIYLHDSP